jgi:hypothetical protein
VHHGDDAIVRTAGADVGFRWGRVAGTAESFIRAIEPRGTGLATVEARGWFVEGGALVTDRFEAGLRYGRLDPDTEVEEDRVSELAPYIDLYIEGDALKLQADYTLTRTERGPGATDPAVVTTDRRLRLQLILAF